jgi:hypothetical protein
MPPKKPKVSMDRAEPSRVAAAAAVAVEAAHEVM